MYLQMIQKGRWLQQLKPLLKGALNWINDWIVKLSLENNAEY
jgi:hypothetical protein